MIKNLFIQAISKFNKEHEAKYNDEKESAILELKRSHQTEVDGLKEELEKMREQNNKVCVKFIIWINCNFNR